MKITLHTIRFENFQKVEDEKKEITEEHYNNYVSSVDFFRSLGGKETIKRSNTQYGKRVVSIISESPNGETVVKRFFEFN